MFKHFLLAALLVVSLATAINCAPAAHCYLTGTSNAAGLRGLVLFTQNSTDLSTIVTWSLVESTVPTALKGKTLGFHVHEYGYIAIANSTGSHFNPNASSHALPSESGVQIHAGDLGNLDLSLGYSGVLNSKLLAFSGAYSVIGRAIRLHMSSDKGSGSQPTGAAGDPAAHCVIGVANANIEAYSDSFSGAIVAAVMRSTTAVSYNVTGRILFTNQTATGLVRVTGKFCGLPANSTHGLHIHQYGQLNYTDPSQVGSHWNPTGSVHGYPGNPVRHAGDLGNITADASGVAYIDLTLDLIALYGSQSILGRAVVLHDGIDDGTNPAGNSGVRAALGIIGTSPATASLSSPVDACVDSVPSVVVTPTTSTVTPVTSKVANSTKTSDAAVNGQSSWVMLCVACLSVIFMLASHF